MDGPVAAALFEAVEEEDGREAREARILRQRTIAALVEGFLARL